MAEAERSYLMNVLEKILEEIDRLDDPYFVGYIDRYEVKRNHPFTHG